MLEQRQARIKLAGSKRTASLQIMSVITYRLQPNTQGETLLVAHEDLKYEMTDQEYEAASEGWDSALIALKETAEKL